MVVNWFVDVLTSLFSWALTLLPSWSAPGFLDSMNSALASIATATASTSVWIPWSTIAVVVPVLMAACLAALAAKGVRVVLSLFTGGGGGAA